MKKLVSNERIHALLAELDSEEDCSKPDCDECDTISALRELLVRRAAEPEADSSYCPQCDCARCATRARAVVNRGGE